MSIDTEIKFANYAIDISKRENSRTIYPWKAIYQGCFSPFTTEWQSSLVVFLAKQVCFLLRNFSLRQYN